MVLSPGTRLDRFELREHLAEGATAQVYRAVDLDSAAEVAIKVPLDRVLADPRGARAWRREVRLTERLRHPRLVGRIDHDQVGSRPYLVLEYLAGGTLRHRLVRDEAVSVDQAVAWGRQLAEALEVLHHNGLVHGDVKPDNAFLTVEGDLKLGDLGAVTRIRHLPLAPPRQVLELARGTAEYMSPEQIRGGHLDGRSDIYSWGIVLYELVTGECPFTGDTELEVMDAHLRLQAPLICELRPEVPAGLEAVILQALRRTAARRQVDMAAVIDDLDHHAEPGAATVDRAADPPLELQPLGGGGQLWRFVAALVVTYLVVVAVLIGLTQALR